MRTPFSYYDSSGPNRLFSTFPVSARSTGWESRCAGLHHKRPRSDHCSDRVTGVTPPETDRVRYLALHRPEWHRIATLACGAFAAGQCIPASPLPTAFALLSWITPPDGWRICWPWHAIRQQATSDSEWQTLVWGSWHSAHIPLSASLPDMEIGTETTPVPPAPQI